MGHKFLQTIKRVLATALLVSGGFHALAAGTNNAAPALAGGWDWMPEPPGKLVPVVETNGAGQKITRYFGDNLTWMAPFMGAGTVVRIARPGFQK